MKKTLIAISIGIVILSTINPLAYADYTNNDLQVCKKDTIGEGYSPYVAEISILQIEKHNKSLTTEQYPHKFKTWVKKLYQGDILWPTEEFGYYLNTARD